MQISIAVQTHPSRREMAESLATDCLERRAEVVYDPEPDSAASAWRTYRAALERTPPEATHRLVVQDDVIVCDGFLQATEAALAARPDRVVAFFVPGATIEHTRAIDEAAAVGAAWCELSLRQYLPVVAACWPVALIPQLLAFVDRQRWPAAFTADDEICGRFLRDIGVGACATVPSLVEHPDDVMSVANGGRRGGTGLDPTRQARWFGCDVDVLGVDWG